MCELSRELHARANPDVDGYEHVGPPGIGINSFHETATLEYVYCYVIARASHSKAVKTQANSHIAAIMYHNLYARRHAKSKHTAHNMVVYFQSRAVLKVYLSTDGANL